MGRGSGGSCRGGWGFGDGREMVWFVTRRLSTSELAKRFLKCVDRFRLDGFVNWCSYRRALIRRFRGVSMRVCGLSNNGSNDQPDMYASTLTSSNRHIRIATSAVRTCAIS